MTPETSQLSEPGSISRSHEAQDRKSTANNLNESDMLFQDNGPSRLWLIVSFLILAIIVSTGLLSNDFPQYAYTILGGGLVAITLLLLSVPLIYARRGQLGYYREYILFREVLEGSRGARLITDVNNRTIFANKKFRTMCEGVGKPSIETLAAIFRDDANAAHSFETLAETASIGEMDSIELSVHQNGKHLRYKITTQPIADWAGFIHWRIDDITKQWRIQNAVEMERAKLTDFTDNAPVGFFSVDEDGRFAFVNATFARWLGTDIETILSEGRLHAYMVDPPKDCNPYDIVANNSVKQVAEVMMKGPGGGTFLASIAQTIVYENEKMVRTRAVVYDLTAEHAIKQALKMSEDRFQRLFEEAPLGILMLDEIYNITDCNEAFAEILSGDIASVEKTSVFQWLDPDEHSHIEKILGNVQRDATMVAPMEIKLNAKGKTIFAHMYARKFLNSDHIVLYFIDLTDQKNLEVQFAQSQKMQAVGQLAGGIAHDFNNLLTAIIGFSDLLLIRHKPGDPSFADIMQIKQNSNRASNLVRQLLAFSRQQTLRPRILDITDTLTELSHLIRRLIGSNIELELKHSHDVGLIKADEGQLEQVLINLAVNARDAMPNGGHLTIETDNYSNTRPVAMVEDTMPPGQWVRITVTDTGSGIPPEIMDRIFEPFFTTKEVGAGTGLGLATVYGIIRQTGGYLSVESKAGEGTKFSIYLPHFDASQVEKKTLSEKTEKKIEDLTGTANILLVEDEDAVRTFSARALTNKGYHVLEAISGEAALDLLNEQKPDIDLLITDVIMPQMDGPTLAKTVLQDRPDLKVIFISGYTEDKFKDQLGEHIQFLPKPFTLKQLAEKVKDVLDG